MKRRLRMFAVFLLLGAIVNVAVAWAAMKPFLSPPSLLYWWSTQTTRVPSGESPLWSRHSSKGWPDLPMMAHEIRGEFGDYEFHSSNSTATIVWDWNRPASELEELMDGIGHFEVNRGRCGFPVRSLSLEQWRGSPQYSGFAPSSGNNGLQLSSFIVPRDVLWPGFAVNTVFYAGILWILFIIPGVWRRKRRLARRLCANCGYDLRGIDSQRCPECGAATPSPPGRGPG